MQGVLLAGVLQGSFSPELGLIYDDLTSSSSTRRHHHMHSKYLEVFAKKSLLSSTHKMYYQCFRTLMSGKADSLGSSLKCGLHSCSLVKIPIQRQQVNLIFIRNILLESPPTIFVLSDSYCWRFSCSVLASARQITS
ncbi:hypothetical protein NA56DRAFT_288076 [Hyaloscypha hepaticicola]|uniref:Uncharacterized protein n=1 Tax=Hyaloscypha hepaticicola TaxID=2082293 RepID=A0A2J6QJU1_9HELO|nr:hypothetical protein NA56DRAFT_288076 [Hyaloscypha hepaticicola]